jgi:hypothetical protein
MFGRHIYTAVMSITSDREGLLNEIYDTEHVPAFKTVPGIIEVRRYRRVAPAGRFYLAVYEIETPDVPTSPDWLRARDLGRWPTQVRPYTSGLHNGLYTWRSGFGGERRADADGLSLIALRLEDPAAIDAAVARMADPSAADEAVVAGADYADLRSGEHLLVIGSRPRAAPEDGRLPRDLAGLGPIETYAPVGSGSVP